MTGSENWRGMTNHCLGATGHMTLDDPQKPLGPMPRLSNAESALEASLGLLSPDTVAFYCWPEGNRGEGRS